MNIAHADTNVISSVIYMSGTNIQKGQTLIESGLSKYMMVHEYLCSIRELHLATSNKVFKFAVSVRVCKLYDDILYILLSKILYDMMSSSSTSSLDIIRYFTAVDSKKDEKVWYNTFWLFIQIIVSVVNITKIITVHFGYLSRLLQIWSV